MAVETSNAQSVERMYEAFGQGDIGAVLEGLADDVAWEHWEKGNSAQDAGVPSLAPRKGRADVAGFFETLARELEFHSFQPLALLEGGRNVAALIRIDVTVKATGRRIEDDEMHLWTFDDSGRVSEFRHFLDTGKHIAANSN